MSADQPTKQPLVKIIEAYRSKSVHKSNKDLSDSLLFKIKPQGSKSQLYVTYSDTKKNFPYSLLQFYEKKLQVKAKHISQIECEQRQKQIPVPQRKTRNSIIKCSQPIKTQEALLPNQPKDKNTNEQLKPIFDYDHLIRKSVEFRQKKFVCVFQSKQFQNPYIRQLAEYQGYQLPKKSVYCQDDSNSVRQKRKKKTKY